MQGPIPFIDLRRQHEPLAETIVTAVGEAIRGAAFVGGPAVSAFEEAFAGFCAAEACVGVGNGTDALMLALRALGIGRDSVVLVPAYTFVATAEAVSMVGATPRLVDVDPQTYTVTAESLRQADLSGVEAVIPVHLYGQSADMDAVGSLAREMGWKVVEDCAQAHGARYRGEPVGSLGDLGAFSFYPAKNLGAMGDAGAVVGPQGEVIERVRRLSNHGRTSHTEHGEPGVNSRLDAIQALALSAKLPHLADWNTQRARVARWYDERLQGTPGVTIPAVGAERSHVYHLYVILVSERDRLLVALRDAGIGCGVHYNLPIHLQPAYQYLGCGEGDFPIAERVATTCLSLPMFPELAEAQVDRVAALVREHVSAGR